jgi:hypothetical protein
VDEMTIDVDQRAAVVELADHVRVPHLVEKGARVLRCSGARVLRC